MKPTTLNDFIGRLVEIGLVAQSQPIKTNDLARNKVAIEVGDTDKTSGYVADYENSLRHYVDVFNEGRYSLLLFDGGMIFIKYVFSNSRSEIDWHRFVYVPSIATLDIAKGDGPDDLPSPDDYIFVPRQAAFRFEFDPQADEDHPPSHLHLNSPKCRMPVSSRLGVAEFVSFLVENFYPDFLDKFREIVPTKMKYGDDLVLKDRGRFRLAAPVLE